VHKEDKRKLTHPWTTVEDEQDDDGKWVRQNKVGGIEAISGSCKLLLLLLKVVVLLLCT
jgi:hypothetical protein